MIPGHGRLSSSRTVSYGQSSEKISIAATLFGGLFVPMSEGSFVKLAHFLRPALQKNERFGSKYHIARPFIKQVFEG